MAEIIINDVKYTNVPNKKAGTKFASALTQSNIGMSQAVQDYVNSSYFYALINAIDINWDGIDIGENTYINTTSDLIKWIESKAGDIDLSSYATVAYVNQKFEDLIGGAPETLDTLKELADALQEDASLAYVTQALEGKANVNDVYTKTEVDNLIPAPVDLSGYVSYTQANSYYVAKEDMPDLNDYATTSYVTTELNKKANTNDVYTKQEVDNMIPEDVDMSNYVSYTQANSYYLKLKTSANQLIQGNVNFVGEFGFPYGSNIDSPIVKLYTQRTDLGGQYKNYGLCIEPQSVGDGLFIQTRPDGGPNYKIIFPFSNDIKTWFGYEKMTFFPLAFTTNDTTYIIPDKRGVVNLSSLIPSAPDMSNYVSYTQANSYYVAKEDMPDMNDYATVSYVTSELDKKADLSDIPSAPDLTNYVSYTDANSYYMTVEGPKQVINSPKTFIGNKLINFRQGTSTDKLGFTLYNSDQKEVGGFEWRPDTINGKPLISLQHYVNTANMSTIAQSYLGFRQTQGNNKYHLLAPIPADVATIETITSSNYKNFFMPLVFKNGSNKVYTDCTGLVDMASLMPDYAIKAETFSTKNYTNGELITSYWNPDNLVQKYYYDGYKQSRQLVFPLYAIKDSTGGCCGSDSIFALGSSQSKYLSLISGFVFGQNNEAHHNSGNNYPLYSNILIGDNLKSNTHHTTVFGIYNNVGTYDESTDISFNPDDSNHSLFVIGNGKNDSNRHNAFEIKRGGQIWIADTYNGTPYSLQSRLNSKANANDVYTKTEVDNLIPAPVDLSNYVSYTQANSYYVDINSYNALAARVEELASWIVSYHTPVIQDVSLWYTSDGSSVASYMSDSGGDSRYVNISDSTTHTINFDSNVNDIVMSVNGISTGITVNNTVWPYSIEYTPSMMTEGGNYSFGFSRNMDSSYNAFSSSFAFTVESSTPEPSKQSPSASWTNTSGGTEVTVVAGDSNTVTCTFNGTPASGWSFGESTIAGVTVNTTTGDVSIDPTNMMSGTYNVDATYYEDNSYYEGYGQLLIRVLPSGTNPNFYYYPDSITIQSDMPSSGTLYNQLSDFGYYEYTSADTSIATVDSTGMVSFVSSGNTTVTATAYDSNNNVLATATLSVYCEVQKTTPSGAWSNISSFGKCIVVAGDTNTVTCTFSGTPESGWTLSDPMTTGITIDSSTMSVTIDPTNMMTGNYHVYAEYPEDSSYNYNNMELLIRVLPSGSDVNFFFENDSYSLDNSMNQSMDIYIETTLGDSISWSSSDTGVCSIAQSPMSWNGATITYVSDGSATLTATIDDNGTTHTATCTVTCSSMTP